MKLHIIYAVTFITILLLSPMVSASYPQHFDVNDDNILDIFDVQLVYLNIGGGTHYDIDENSIVDIFDVQMIYLAIGGELKPEPSAFGWLVDIIWG